MKKQYAVSFYSINAQAMNRIAIKIMNKDRWRISKTFITNENVLVIIWEKPIKKFKIRNEKKL